MGAAAKQQVVSNMKNTVWGWKKFIGRKYNDPVVQEEQSKVPYEVAEGPEGSTVIKVM